MKWDPRIQDYVEEYAPLEEPPRRGAGVLIGAVVALFLASVFVVLAVNAGEIESEAAAPKARALPTPSPAAGGDLPLTKEGVDNAAFSILYGYIKGGPEQAAFIVQDIQQRTGCNVVYGRIGTIAGVREGFEQDTRRLEKRYGRMAGSALMDGVGINIAFDCGAA